MASRHGGLERGLKCSPGPMKRASVASGLHDKGTAELSEGSSREEHTQKMV